jgi:O-antigen/teichoic acid export membrane protein
VLAFAHAAMHLATWLFFIGIVGSLLVIVISFAEDLHELLGKD